MPQPGKPNLLIDKGTSVNLPLLYMIYTNSYFQKRAFIVNLKTFAPFLLRVIIPCQ